MHSAIAVRICCVWHSSERRGVRLGVGSALRACVLAQHKRRRRAHVSKRGVHPEHRKRGGCDGRYEKKYEKKYEYSRFLLLFAAETRFAGLLSHADECCCPLKRCSK